MPELQAFLDMIVDALKIYFDDIANALLALTKSAFYAEAEK